VLKNFGGRVTDIEKKADLPEILIETFPSSQESSESGLGSEE
jgi:hypothetical protein